MVHLESANRHWHRSWRTNSTRLVEAVIVSVPILVHPPLVSQALFLSLDGNRMIGRFAAMKLSAVSMPVVSACRWF
jgi:hypothetical protein